MRQDGARKTSSSIRMAFGSVRMPSTWLQDVMVSSGGRQDSVEIASGWGQDDATRT